MPYQGEGSGETENGHEPPQPAGVPEHGIPNGDNAKNESQEEAEPSQDSFDRDLVRWTKVLAFFTGALVFAAGLQFWVMQGQLSEMKAARISGDQGSTEQIGVLKAQADAMREQLAQMKTANSRMEDSIGASRQLAEETASLAAESRRLADSAVAANATSRQLATAAIQANKINTEIAGGIHRAFVQVNDIAFTPLSSVGDKSPSWIADINLQNTGDVQTVGMKAILRCLVGDARERVPDFSRFPNYEGNGLQPHPMALGPHETKNLGFCSLFPGLYKDRGGATWHRMFVYGSVYYVDALDKRVPRITEFCYDITIDDEVNRKNRVYQPIVDADYWRGATLPCQTHNCKDQECGKEDQQLALSILSLPTRSVIQNRRKK